ncbi:hypothetical protein HUX88_28995 [Duganella sp. BJB1802]|uniref:hypothetical protein n=1 Tax=Duganella sp. BJB1802 TaxID=2744575 RepID=UPI001593A4B1|nr:hypothetical protein [Duganella sp. BJB1802]NVD74526.1 hypothetical protein [Duganella sp. BJB1802]
MWLIQKIGLNEAGEIDRVQWQRADTSRNAWVGAPEIVPVIDVVDAVLISKVGSSFASEGGQGPYVRTTVGANGVEGIEADPSDGNTRSLLDLPRL